MTLVEREFRLSAASNNFGLMPLAVVDARACDTRASDARTAAPLVDEATVDDLERVKVAKVAAMNEDRISAANKNCVGEERRGLKGCRLLT